MNLIRLLCLASLITAVGLALGCKPKQSAPTTNNAPVSSATKDPASRSPDEVALLDASIKGDAAAVQALLDKGVSPNTKDSDGRTPLTEAAYYGHTQIVKMLIGKGADVWAKKRDGETPVTMAAGHADIVQLLKTNLDLIDAARAGDNKAVQSLLDKGAYVNSRDSDGRTPLTEATWEGHAETVKLLLEKGADPNLKKNDGLAPLVIAVGKGNKEIEELLKKAGAK
ncbi:MAG TPA: ankyrin repeat domain-containing protein [Pyrinomonadaceae bacterium]|nr:ankyrin repeat domain-containing protein [Pyrinomonadaceae bacterium]